jgi:hypothetical protein
MRTVHKKIVKRERIIEEQGKNIMNNEEFNNLFS